MKAEGIVGIAVVFVCFVLCFALRSLGRSS